MHIFSFVLLKITPFQGWILEVVPKPLFAAIRRSGSSSTSKVIAPEVQKFMPSN